MLNPPSLIEALGGASCTLASCDGELNASLARGLADNSIKVGLSEIKPTLSNSFALSGINMKLGQGNVLQDRAEPGMGPAQPVVSQQRLQPLQRQFS